MEQQIFNNFYDLIDNQMFNSLNVFYSNIVEEFYNDLPENMTFKQDEYGIRGSDNQYYNIKFIDKMNKLHLSDYFKYDSNAEILNGLSNNVFITTNNGLDYVVNSVNQEYNYNRKFSRGKEAQDVINKVFNDIYLKCEKILHNIEVLEEAGLSKYIYYIGVNDCRIFVVMRDYSHDLKKYLQLNPKQLRFMYYDRLLKLSKNLSSLGYGLNNNNDLSNIVVSDYNNDILFLNIVDVLTRYSRSEIISFRDFKRIVF